MVSANHASSNRALVVRSRADIPAARLFLIAFANCNVSCDWLVSASSGLCQCDVPITLHSLVTVVYLDQQKNLHRPLHKS